MATVLEIPDRYGIVFEMPIEHVGDGVRLTLIGEDELLQQALSGLPEDIQLDLERTGTYHPTRQHLSSVLITRQREILSIAVRTGYYEIPRQTTHEEIADIAGVSTATTSEHLRKIEQRVFSTLIE